MTRKSFASAKLDGILILVVDLIALIFLMSNKEQSETLISLKSLWATYIVSFLIEMMWLSGFRNWLSRLKDSKHILVYCIIKMAVAISISCVAGFGHISSAVVLAYVLIIYDMVGILGLSIFIKNSRE